MPPIPTDRLDLVSLSSQSIESLLAGQKHEAERLVGLRLPEGWPDEHDARFLRMRVDQLRANADWQEWLVRAMVLREVKRPMIGHIGFHGPPEAIGRAEMGYTVFQPFRRRGFASEAARGMMAWARGRHGTERMYLSISPDNEPSLAMAAKLGFRQVGEQIDEEDGLEFVFELILA